MCKNQNNSIAFTEVERVNKTSSSSSSCWLDVDDKSNEIDSETTSGFASASAMYIINIIFKTQFSQIMLFLELDATPVYTK